MKYRNSIIALGFLVMLIQFLGFPQSMRNVFYSVVGLAIISIAYICKHDSRPVEGVKTNNNS